jgi:hypothetical protein
MTDEREEIRREAFNEGEAVGLHEGEEMLRNDLRNRVLALFDSRRVDMDILKHELKTKENLSIEEISNLSRMIVRIHYKLEELGLVLKMLEVE